MLVLKCLGLGKDLTLYFVPSIMYHLPLNPSLLLLPILTSNQVHNVTDPANRQFYFSWDWLVLFVPFLLKRLIKQIICLFFCSSVPMENAWGIYLICWFFFLCCWWFCQTKGCDKLKTILFSCIEKCVEANLSLYNYRLISTKIDHWR